MSDNTGDLKPSSVSEQYGALTKWALDNVAGMSQMFGFMEKKRQLFKEKLGLLFDAHGVKEYNLSKYSDKNLEVMDGDLHHVLGHLQGGSLNAQSIAAISGVDPNTCPSLSDIKRRLPSTLVDKSTGSILLSINPLDFLFSSDFSGWSSCYSVHKGADQAGGGRMSFCVPGSLSATKVAAGTPVPVDYNSLKKNGEDLSRSEFPAVPKFSKKLGRRFMYFDFADGKKDFCTHRMYGTLHVSMLPVIHDLVQLGGSYFSAPRKISIQSAVAVGYQDPVVGGINHSDRSFALRAMPLFIPERWHLGHGPKGTSTLLRCDDCGKRSTWKDEAHPEGMKIVPMDAHEAIPLDVLALCGACYVKRFGSCVECKKTGVPLVYSNPHLGAGLCKACTGLKLEKYKEGTCAVCDARAPTTFMQEVPSALGIEFFVCSAHDILLDGCCAPLCENWAIPGAQMCFTHMNPQLRGNVERLFQFTR